MHMIGVDLLSNRLFPNDPIPTKTETQQIPNSFNTLMGLESTCKSALSLLSDHNERALIAECFPALFLELDKIKQAFIEFFNDKESNEAVRLACYVFPNAFLIFVSYIASEFDGDAFWIKLFDQLSINDQNIQNQFKKIFYKEIIKRDFPRFTNEEETFYLLYTALLHGGFSTSFWESIWHDVIFPYTERHSYSSYSLNNGAEIVQLLRNDNDDYQPREFVRAIIKKAPVNALVPLFDSALQVRAEIINIRECGYEQIVSDHGLPQTAMQALKNLLESQTQKVNKKNANQHYHTSNKFISLPTAELILDIANRTVLLHWNPQKLPTEYCGYQIDYSVNGIYKQSATILMGIGDAYLEKQDILVDPCERYETELILKNPRTGWMAEPITQTFKHTRPGTFEFIQTSDGVYRLRKINENYKKTKRVAYLTKSDLWVEPKYGMEEIATYEAAENWNSASIQIFEVEPSACGSIINLETEDEIVSWQEKYQVEIDRSNVIGKTKDRRDVYGYKPNSYHINQYLPDITIHAFDTNTLKNDIDIICKYNGQTENQSTWENEINLIEIYSDRLVIRACGPHHKNISFIKDGEINIFQKSTNNLLVDYKFVIVPIISFGITELKYINNIPYATYSILLADNFKNISNDSSHDVANDNLIKYEKPLNDSTMTLSITSKQSNKKLEFDLYLAGLEIIRSKDIERINLDHPICMSDIHDAIDGRIRIISHDKRNYRAIYVSIGSDPLFYKSIKGSSNYSFDIFNDNSIFKYKKYDKRKDAILTLQYGLPSKKGNLIPAQANLILAECTTGFGLGKWTLNSKEQETYICFEHNAPCDLDFEFSNKKYIPIGSSSLLKGKTKVHVPTNVAESLNNDGHIYAKVIYKYKDIFGDMDTNTFINLYIYKELSKQDIIHDYSSIKKNIKQQKENESPSPSPSPSSTNNKFKQSTRYNKLKHKSIVLDKKVSELGEWTIVYSGQSKFLHFENNVPYDLQFKFLDPGENWSEIKILAQGECLLQISNRLWNLLNKKSVEVLISPKRYSVFDTQSSVDLTIRLI